MENTVDKKAGDLKQAGGETSGDAGTSRAKWNECLGAKG